MICFQLFEVCVGVTQAVAQPGGCVLIISNNT